MYCIFKEKNFLSATRKKMLLPIQGWDYTTTSCSSDFIPVFYFIPDYEWVSYLNINGPINVPIQITGTGLYDGKHWIRIDKQPETLWYMGFLSSFSFLGYPERMGNVELNDQFRKECAPPFLQCEMNGCC